LYQITADPITPDQVAIASRSPFSLSSTEFVEPPRTKFLVTPLIQSRIAMAKAAFSKKKKNLFTSKLDLHLWKKELKCNIWSVAL